MRRLAHGGAATVVLAAWTVLLPALGYADVGNDGRGPASALGSPAPQRTNGPGTSLSAPPAPSHVDLEPTDGRAPQPRRGARALTEEEGDTTRSTTFDLAASTHLPLSVGAELGVELPGRLLAQLHIGWLPESYASLVNRIATNRGWYGEGTGAVVRRVLNDSVLLRPAVGWRPGPDAGFEMWIGYTHFRTSGRMTGRELQDAGLVDRMPRGAEASMSGRLHGVTAGVAWRFVVADHVLVRTGIFYTKVLSAGLQVSSPFPAVNRSVEEEVGDILASRVQSVELRLAVGYRL